MLDQSCIIVYEMIDVLFFYGVLYVTEKGFLTCLHSRYTQTHSLCCSFSCTALMAVALGSITNVPGPVGV